MPKNNKENKKNQ